MTDATLPLTTADGKPLKAALAASLAVRRRRALLLVAPLFLFIFLTFIVPIGQMLVQSFHNDSFSANAPNLGLWFSEHPEGSAIDESAWAALAADLKLMREQKTAGQAGTRINYDVSGTRSLFTSSARKADKSLPG